MTTTQNVRGGTHPLRSMPPDPTPPGARSAHQVAPFSEEDGPPRTPSEAPDPVVISGGEQTGRASVTVDYCSYCFNVATDYRSDLAVWLCQPCSASNPQMCENCQTRPADIIEFGYAACSFCRAGRKS